MVKQFWTEEELEKLKALYSNHNALELSKILNRNPYQIYNKANTLGLKKSQEYLKNGDSGRLKKGESLGTQFQFKKGQIPPNKGKKMPEELYKKCEPTMFKSGSVPHNTKQD